jgi:ABC-2 type transport system permease protein
MTPAPPPPAVQLPIGGPIEAPIETAASHAWDYDSARRESPMAHELIELLRYRDLVAQLVARNIKVRYKRSALGVVWSMLSPLLTTIVLSVVFLTVFQAAAPNYPVYLLSGLLIWNFFVQTTSTMAAEMIGGADLWKRIYTPRTVYAVATTVTGLVHLAMALVPLFALALVLGMPLSLAPLATAAIAVLCVALFALGVGLMLSVVSARFPDVVDLYQVIVGAWLYLTPVIYPRQIVPERFQWMMALNPMTWFVEAFRLPVYQNTVPPPRLLVMSFTLALITAVVGWWAFTRSADDFASRL